VLSIQNGTTRAVTEYKAIVAERPSANQPAEPHGKAQYENTGKEGGKKTKTEPAAQPGKDSPTKPEDRGEAVADRLDSTIKELNTAIRDQKIVKGLGDLKKKEGEHRLA
jgi:hypothetical protein